MTRWTSLSDSKVDTQPPAVQRSGNRPNAAPLLPDPYANWAELSGWRGYQRMGAGATSGPPADVRILARAKNLKALDKALRDKTLTIPDVYQTAVPGAQGQAKALHFTATLRQPELSQLQRRHPNLVWELAVPRRPPLTQERVDLRGDQAPTRSPESMRAPMVVPDPGQRLIDRFEQSEKSPISPASAAAVMGVIDFGLPFLDPCFATPGGGATRIHALWDQDHERPPEAAHGCWWVRPAKSMGYGRVLTRPAIEALRDHLRQPKSGAACDEAALYRSIDYLIGYGDARRRALFASHGATIADLACGFPDPMARFRKSGVEDMPDPAALADLLFVQLPGLTAGDSTGSSLGAQLLDAVRWIMCQAGAIKDGAARPLIITISYGSYAGAHDGTSLIETAMDELLDLRQDNFAIVLAAGNSRRERCHVRRTAREIGRNSRRPLLRLDLPPDDSTDSFVEVWSRKSDGKNPGSLEARVRAPSGPWSDWVGQGKDRSMLVLSDPATRKLMGMLQFVPNPPGSKSKSLLLLSLAPTLPTGDDDGPVVPPGIWELEIRAGGGSTEDIEFDAWVERDDPGEVGLRSQTRFLTVDPLDEFNTLSSIATGRHTLLAGAFRLSSGRPTAYSSLPALAQINTDFEERMVLVAAEEDDWTPSLRAAAVRSNDVFRMNGTSVAAPILARLLLDTMHLGTVSRSQWPQVLDTLAAQSGDSLVRKFGDPGL